MHQRIIAVALLATLAAATGCKTMSDPVLRPDSGAMVMGDVTYYGDVRPILVANCLSCHAEGGIAPFHLASYAASVEVADRMAEVTHDRIMPPFLADNSGDCQTWSNFRGLTQEEIDTIGNWVLGGTLEGDPTTPEPNRPELLALPSVGLTVEMPDTYTVNAELDDDYRCFVVDVDTTEDVFVTGYNVRPGNAQRVHHVIMYNPSSEGEVDRAVALDAEDGVMGNGYECFGGPRVSAPPIVLWAPGTNATIFPARPRQTGIQLVAGRRQIVQIHYNNLVEGAPEDDLTRIDLMTSTTATMAFLVPLINSSLNLPPRMEEVVASRTIPLSSLGLPTNVRIWGQFPHMHTLGQTLRIDLNDDMCMLNVPRWDFDWQLAYWYERPITVGPEDTATLTCTFNTMERDETVRWGDGTQDEMCLSFVYVTF